METSGPSTWPIPFTDGVPGPPTTASRTVKPGLRRYRQVRDDASRSRRVGRVNMPAAGGKDDLPAPAAQRWRLDHAFGTRRHLGPVPDMLQVRLFGRCLRDYWIRALQEAYGVGGDMR